MLKALPWRGCIAFLWLAHPVFALNPGLAFNQLSHTVWTSREGYTLTAVEALSQTTDGHLWLGTHRGLVRFDGTTFSPWQTVGGETLPSGKITALFASLDGGLWAACQGEIIQVRGSRVRRYSLTSSVEAGAIRALVEDDSGTLWAGGGRAKSRLLATIRNGSLRLQDSLPWLPQAPIRSMFRDSRGHIWIGTSAGICESSAGKPVGCWFTASAAHMEAIQSSPSGEIVALDGGAPAIRKFSDGIWRTWVTGQSMAGVLARSLLVDRDECLWFGTVGQGLFRVCSGAMERFTKQDGLTSDLVLSLMEDREGNIWVGTSNGLDRFHEPSVSRVSIADGLSGNTCTAVCASRDGSVWVGTSSGGLDRVVGRQISHHAAFPTMAHAVALSLHEDEGGRLWVGSTAGLCYRGRAGLVEVRDPGGNPLNRVVAMADSGGVLWAADLGRGIFRILHGRAEPAPDETPAAQHDIFELSMDRQGRLWQGYYSGGVSVCSRARQSFGKESGMVGGPVQAIREDRDGAIWVGAGQGLSRFRNGRWTTWGPQHGLQHGVQGISTTAEGDIWLLTAAGLLRLDATELGKTPDSQPSYLSFRVYGPPDAIQFTETRRMVNPRMTRSQDGHIWISTDDGLYTVDPSRLRNSAAPPPVNIEQVLVDGRALEMAGGAAEFRGHEIEIQLVALSLGIPQAVDVNYRLEGFDQDWHTAKSPMRIVYGRLPPGNYRFRAMALNPDGAWSKAGAIVTLRKLPEFYQTFLFRLACVLAVVGINYALYRFRVSVLRARFRLVLRERNRIARELHDTLLQGFAGAVYLMKGASAQLEISPERGKQHLNSAIIQANQSLREARQALACLRLPELENQTLTQALEASGRKIVSGASIAFHMEVAGRPQELCYETEANLYIIAREAMSNALSHASPAHINLKLAYGRAQVTMFVEDDGAGFDPQEALSKANHWGLTGMQERVRAIQGKMTLDSRPLCGTRIEVTVPLPGRLSRVRSPVES